MKISDAPQKRGQLRWVMHEHEEPVPGSPTFSIKKTMPILQQAEYPPGETALRWVDVPMALEP
jgi:hypothetical protein